MKHRKPPNNEDWYESRDILIFSKNILLEFDDLAYNKYYTVPRKRSPNQ